MDADQPIHPEDRMYCPLAQTCPYARDLPEHVRQRPIYQIPTGDIVVTDEYLTPDLHEAVIGLEYRCEAVDRHEGKAYQCAVTETMGLVQTAMRFTHELWRALVRAETGEEPHAIPPAVDAERYFASIRQRLGEPLANDE